LPGTNTQDYNENSLIKDKTSFITLDPGHGQFALSISDGENSFITLTKGFGKGLRVSISLQHPQLPAEHVAHDDHERGESLLLGVKPFRQLDISSATFYKGGREPTHLTSANFLIKHLQKQLA
jgi:hypothetical protein